MLCKHLSLHLTHPVLGAGFERNCFKLKSFMDKYPKVHIRPHAKVRRMQNGAAEAQGRQFHTSSTRRTNSRSGTARLSIILVALNHCNSSRSLSSFLKHTHTHGTFKWGRSPHVLRCEWTCQVKSTACSKCWPVSVQSARLAAASAPAPALVAASTASLAAAAVAAERGGSE